MPAIPGPRKSFLPIPATQLETAPPGKLNFAEVPAVEETTSGIFVYGSIFNTRSFQLSAI